MKSMYARRKEVGVPRGDLFKLKPKLPTFEAIACVIWRPKYSMSVCSMMHFMTLLGSL